MGYETQPKASSRGEDPQALKGYFDYTVFLLDMGCHNSPSQCEEDNSVGELRNAEVVPTKWSRVQILETNLTTNLLPFAYKTKNPPHTQCNENNPRRLQ